MNLRRLKLWARSRARFGSLSVAADECRDARGTALVDSVVRDVLYACRSFRRARLAALTIVTTVALGLGLVAVVFTFPADDLSSQFLIIYMLPDGDRASDRISVSLKRPGATLRAPIRVPK